jgi:hypothetical protein
MIPINNSDTAWLIVTDYLQDNDLPYLDLRNDIISPDVNQWIWDDPDMGITVGDKFNLTGTRQTICGSNLVGNDYHIDDMRFSNGNVGGEFGIGLDVGGNHDPNQ